MILLVLAIVYNTTKAPSGSLPAASSLEPEESEQNQLEPEITQNTASENSISDNSTPQNNVTENNALESNVPENNTSTEFVHPERVTYMEGFYSEPISDPIKERINGLSYKEDCTVPYEDLRYLRVLYKNFDNETASGEIICNKAIAQDLMEIFYELYQNDYQIAQIRLIDEFCADDDISCAKNNTSCFNYRVVGGTTNLSKHALGLAIDINPLHNPYITYPDGVERITPVGSEIYADRDADFEHKIDYDDLCYKLFTERDFTWGGDWKTMKDYQHFQREL